MRLSGLFSWLCASEQAEPISLNVKLPNNFSVVFSFWDNYDSRPPISTAKKNELGVGTNLGYTF